MNKTLTRHAIIKSTLSAAGSFDKQASFTDSQVQVMQAALPDPAEQPLVKLAKLLAIAEATAAA